jgi:hypothetical protein
MLSGKLFQLKRAVLALESVASSGRAAETVPPGAIIRVVGERKDKDTDDPMVDILWSERRFAMFTIDLQERGEELPRGLVGNVRAGREPNGVAFDPR